MKGQIASVRFGDVVLEPGTYCAHEACVSKVDEAPLLTFAVRAERKQDLTLTLVFVGGSVFIPQEI